MDPKEAANAFRETAGTYGLAVAILIILVLALGFILFRFGNRMMASQDRYIDSRIEADKAIDRRLSIIEETLPHVCKADCPASPPPRQTTGALNGAA